MAVVASLFGFYAAQLLIVVFAIVSLIARHRFVHVAVVAAGAALVAATAVPIVPAAVATGVPLEAAVTATFLMRGFSFRLPMIPGLWFARRELAPRAAGGSTPSPS